MAQFEKREILLRIMTEEGCRTKADFAERVGVTPQAVSNWLTRDSFPELKVISAFPNISPDFIKFGREPYLRDSQNEKSEPIQDNQPGNIDRLLAVIEKQQTQIDRLISIIEDGKNII